MFRRSLLLVLLALAGCSTVETSGGGASVAAFSPTERIELKVRTGNEQMDALVYEMAYHQFSEVMPLREKEPYTSVLEITFASTGQSGFLGTTSSVGSLNATTTGWYTGGRVASSSISSGSFLEWQNSTMLAVLKHLDGQRIWSADYSYKGGWELSGWVVNTPEEAARLITKRLKARFVADSKR